MALNRYLKYSKEVHDSLGESSLRHLRIVIGNESCDLDSAVSAVVFAFFLYSLDKKKEQGEVVPVLNIKRVNYPLRTEVMYWFEKHGILEEDLIFRDEIDIGGLSAQFSVQLMLVDHNVLPVQDAHLEDLVAFILDHHHLERTDTPVHGIVVEPVGSCSSLVTEQIVTKLPDILCDVSSLLLGTILLDTINLDEGAKRVTSKDVQMVNHLETVLDPNTDRAKVFEELKSAKTDISALTSLQLLGKDLKAVCNDSMSVAVSSLPMLVTDFLKRLDAMNALDEFSVDYEVVLLMGIQLSGEVLRDLVVYTKIHPILVKLSNYLVESENPSLQLTRVDVPHKYCHLFSQGNVSASRKVVLPLVKRFLDGGSL